MSTPTPQPRKGAVRRRTRPAFLMLCWMGTATMFWAAGNHFVSAWAAMTAVMFALSGAFDLPTGPTPSAHETPVSS